MANQTSRPRRPGAVISRRQFLHHLAATGGAAVIAFLQGCSAPSDAPASGALPTGAPASATPPATSPAATATSTTTIPPTAAAPTTAPTASSPTPAAVGASTVGVVALVKTANRADGVRQAIDLLGFNPVEGKRVFLKPNFNSADPAPGSTHPEVLRALVFALQGMGAARITVGDRSGMGDTRRVMEQLGVFSLAQEMGFETVVLDELPAEGWEMLQPPESHWSRGFPFARPALEAEAVVQTCCLKTHRFGGHVTLSLKNAVGLAGKRIPTIDHDFMSELHGSPHQRRMVAEINTAYTPALVVMDGVEAFISGGPDRGEIAPAQVILAGTDRVALDAVGIALLRLHGCKTEAARGKVFAQEQIARAVELGLGVDSPEKITFLTPDADSAAYAEQVRALL